MSRSSSAAVQRPGHPASVQARVACEPEGLGERVPVRALERGRARGPAQGPGPGPAGQAEPLRYHTLACQRRLAAGSRLELVWAGRGHAGRRATARKRWSFQVREAFAASFSCERENAQAACLPIRP
jgi:hypothetical protein